MPSRLVLIAIALFIVVYVGLDLNKLYALRYGQDQGTFLQFLVDEARHGSSWNGAEHRPHLQVHDSWSLLLFVPFVALIPRQETLIVLQVVLVALAAWPLFAFARACGATGDAANVVALAYVLAPTTQSLAYGNFTENVFVPLLATSAALAVRERNLVVSLLFAQLLLGLKEDQAPFLCWFGIACIFWWNRPIGIGITALAIVNGVGYELAERMHHVAPQIPQYALSIFDPGQKALFFVTLLAMSAFAPLVLGRRLLLAAPLVAELVFARPWTNILTRIGTHYTAAIFTATMLATAVAVAKHPRFVRPVLICAILSALLLNDTVLKAGRWPFIVDWNAYRAAYALTAVPHRVVLATADEGVYAVAAANLNVVLAGGIRTEHLCPAFNRDAPAFFASIGMGSWPPDTRLCGGVADAAPPR
jgi:uncharacterized membrane protein